MFPCRLPLSRSVPSTAQFLSRLVAGPEQIAAMAQGGRVISDLRPYRMVSEEHPDEAEVFSPFFPDNAPAQSRELRILLEAHRADPTDLIHQSRGYQAR